MRPLRLLITAGPTHEPIDRVRYLANRSSGRVGIEIAEAALDRNWETTLALGPTPLQPRTTPLPSVAPDADPHSHARGSRFHVIRFETTADLEQILREQAHKADILIMAAAVADYRPVNRVNSEDAGKLRRHEDGLTLELESTPDLVAACAEERSKTRSGLPSLIVGFALEPANRLTEAAMDKMKRKGLDLIVANPLETMDAPDIHATVFDHEGEVASTHGKLGKDEFARWLITLVEKRFERRVIGD